VFLGARGRCPGSLVRQLAHKTVLSHPRTVTRRAALFNPLVANETHAGANNHTRVHTDGWCSVKKMMPPAADEPEYLKVEEVAARLKLKEKTIRDWILRGELPAYKLGKEWRIRRDDFDQAMQARRTTAEPAPTGGLWDPDNPG
jgi:excisionase family DNA binding protein